MNSRKPYKDIDYDLMKEKIRTLSLEAEKGMERVSGLEKKIKEESKEELFQAHKEVIMTAWKEFVTQNKLAKEYLTKKMEAMEKNNDKDSERSKSKNNGRKIVRNKRLSYLTHLHYPFLRLISLQYFRQPKTQLLEFLCDGIGERKDQRKLGIRNK